MLSGRSYLEKFRIYLFSPWLPPRWSHTLFHTTFLQLNYHQMSENFQIAFLGRPHLPTSPTSSPRYSFQLVFPRVTRQSAEGKWRKPSLFFSSILVPEDILTQNQPHAPHPGKSEIPSHWIFTLEAQCGEGLSLCCRLTGVIRASQTLTASMVFNCFRK